jgi:hypothetical protein
MPRYRCKSFSCSPSRCSSGCTDPSPIGCEEHYEKQVVVVVDGQAKNGLYDGKTQIVSTTDSKTVEQYLVHAAFQKDSKVRQITQIYCKSCWTGLKETEKRDALDLSSTGLTSVERETIAALYEQVKRKTEQKRRHDRQVAKTISMIEAIEVERRSPPKRPVIEIADTRVVPATGLASIDSLTQDAFG